MTAKVSPLLELLLSQISPHCSRIVSCRERPARRTRAKSKFVRMPTTLLRAPRRNARALKSRRKTYFATEEASRAQQRRMREKERASPAWWVCSARRGHMSKDPQALWRRSAAAVALVLSALVAFSAPAVPRASLSGQFVTRPDCGKAAPDAPQGRSQHHGQCCIVNCSSAALAASVAVITEILNEPAPRAIDLFSQREFPRTAVFRSQFAARGPPRLA